jgi:hypothetical protein
MFHHVVPHSLSVLLFDSWIHYFSQFRHDLTLLDDTCREIVHFVS